MVTCEWACASEEVDGNDLMEDKMTDIDVATVDKDKNPNFYGIHDNVTNVVEQLPSRLNTVRRIAIVYGRPQQEIAHFEDKVNAIVMQSYGGEKLRKG